MNKTAFLLVSKRPTLPSKSRTTRKGGRDDNKGGTLLGFETIYCRQGVYLNFVIPSTVFFISCLENPMDRGAWESTVHRAAQSWTWLK